MNQMVAGDAAGEAEVSQTQVIVADILQATAEVAAVAHLIIAAMEIRALDLPVHEHPTEEAIRVVGGVRATPEVTAIAQVTAVMETQAADLPLHGNPADEATMLAVEGHHHQHAVRQMQEEGIKKVPQDNT